DAAGRVANYHLRKRLGANRIGLTSTTPKRSPMQNVIALTRIEFLISVLTFCSDCQNFFVGSETSAIKRIDKSRAVQLFKQTNVDEILWIGDLRRRNSLAQICQNCFKTLYRRVGL